MAKLGKARQHPGRQGKGGGGGGGGARAAHAQQHGAEPLHKDLEEAEEGGVALPCPELAGGQALEGAVKDVVAQAEGEGGGGEQAVIEDVVGRDSLGAMASNGHNLRHVGSDDPEAQDAAEDDELNPAKMSVLAHAEGEESPEDRLSSLPRRPRGRRRTALTTQGQCALSTGTVAGARTPTRKRDTVQHSLSQQAAAMKERTAARREQRAAAADAARRRMRDFSRDTHAAAGRPGRRAGGRMPE